MIIFRFLFLNFIMMKIFTNKLEIDKWEMLIGAPKSYGTKNSYSCLQTHACFIETVWEQRGNMSNNYR